MADLNNIFKEFQSFLETETVIKDQIRCESKHLEKIVHAVTMNIENLHRNVNDQNIRVVCRALRAELLKVRPICKRLDDVIPEGEFYRYCGPIKNNLSKLVQAVALIMYFIENKAVTRTEAGLILGLRTRNFSDVPSGPTASSGFCAATADATAASSSNDERHSDMPAAVPESAAWIVTTPRRGPSETLAVSNDGEVTLVLTPASPLPSASSEEGKVDEVAKSPPSCTPPTAASDRNQLAASSSSADVDIPVDVDDSARAKENQSSEMSSPSGCPVLRSSEPLLCSYVNCEEEGGPAGLALYLDLEDFLAGWLMVGSELARLAVNAVSSENYCLPFRINSFLRELHAGFSLLNFKNNFLRKSYDELKYSLKKTEDVVYNLSLRQLRPSEQELQEATPTSSSILEFYSPPVC